MGTYMLRGDCGHVLEILFNCTREQARAYGLMLRERGTCKVCGTKLGEIWAAGVTEEYAKELSKHPDAKDMSRF